MDDALKEKVNEILEGIANLKERTDFNILEHRNRLWEVETGINKYVEHGEIEGLRHALQVFHETAILSKEGANTFDETIWNANVQVKDKMTLLDFLFSDLEKLVGEEYQK